MRRLHAQVAVHDIRPRTKLAHRGGRAAAGQTPRPNGNAGGTSTATPTRVDRAHAGARQSAAGESSPVHGQAQERVRSPPHGRGGQPSDRAAGTREADTRKCGLGARIQTGRRSSGDDKSYRYRPTDYTET